MQIGLERCATNLPPALAKGRVGLLMNQASVDRDLTPAHVVLSRVLGGRLDRLFSPQHGLCGEQQDNMVETAHGRDDLLGLPVHSLYSEIRRPTAQMLDGLDVLAVDLQDVGCRVYTFVWTVTYCMEVCAELGIPVVVLDRPNPVGGTLVEGAPLRPGFESFVGRAPIPMRHGLTLGELADHLNRAMGLGAELHVVPMDGWRRDQFWSDLDRPWVAPSPNLPRFEGALVYPGQVLLEGTNLSEGRGTTQPFEFCGAPFIRPRDLKAAVDAAFLPGVHFRAVRFEPTFQKWRGESCGGLSLHVTDPAVFRPYLTTLTLLNAVASQWPGEFAWREPPYEYEIEGWPIDFISGCDALRAMLDAGQATAGQLRARCDANAKEWWRTVAECLRYPVAASAAG